jgi:hypothetical protein
LVGFGLPCGFEGALPVSYEYEPRDLELIKEYCESTPDYDAYLAPAFSIRFNTNLIDSAHMIYHTVEAVQGSRVESMRVEYVLAVRDIIKEREGIEQIPHVPPRKWAA